MEIDRDVAWRAGVRRGSGPLKRTDSHDVSVLDERSGRVCGSKASAISPVGGFLEDRSETMLMLLRNR